MQQKTTIWLCTLVSLVLLTSFVFATQYVIPSSFSVNESISYFYNFTINNSAAGGGSANITEINITIPSGFSFVASSNGSSATNNFSSTTSVLSWENRTFYLIANGTNQSFWFNATANTTTLGTFHFNLSVLNSTGITYFDIPVTVNDTTKPLVLMTAPQNATYFAATKPTGINYIFADNGALANLVCWYSVNDGTTNTSLACGTNVSSLSPTEGQNKWLVSINDSGNNVNMSRILFVSDTVSPNVSYGARTETSTTNLSRNWFVVNVTGADNNTALSNINISVYNSAGVLVNSTKALTSPNYINYTNMADGFYYFNASSTDNAGNLNFTTTYNITLDTTSPATTYFVSPSVNNTNISHDFLINVSATDNLLVSAVSINVSNSTISNMTIFTFSATSAYAAMNINITSLPEGNYSVAIATNDSVNNVNTTTWMFHLDRTLPYNLSFLTPTNATFTNLSSNWINYSLVAADTNAGVHNVTAYLVYSNGTLAASASANGTTLAGAFTSLSDGIYNLSANASDYASNTNGSVSGGTRTFIVDTTTPLITLNNVNVTTSQAKFDVTVVESGSGIMNCTVNSASASPTSWTGAAQTITETKESGVTLTCDTKITRTVVCTDYAGNPKSALITMTTSGCPTSSAPSSGSGGSSSTTSWSSTYYKNSAELSTLGDVNQALGNNERLGIKVANTQHYVGVTALTASSATIQVASTPQVATFSIGDTKKFEITGDNYYDLSITLDSIANNKASFTITSINETMTPEQVKASDAAKAAGANATQPANNNAATPASTSSSSTWIWWVVVIVVVLVLIWLFARKKKNHNKR